MNWFEQLMYSLNQIRMEQPTSFGWFHLMSVGIGLLVIVYLRLTKKKDNEKRFTNVLFTYAFWSFLLELTKQIMWSFKCDTYEWDYQWYAFPFQLCTTPLIVCLVYKFIKNENIREHLRAYLAFFTIIASISVMFYPDTCFTTYVEVNIYTMFLHIGAFVISMYILLGGFVKLNFKELIKGYKVFLIFVFIALILNISMYKSGILNGETFNMFYISPYFETILPVFNLIQPKVPYVVFLLIYVVAFLIGAIAILGVAKLFKTKKNRLEENK